MSSNRISMGQITCSLPYGDDFLKEVRDQVQVLSNARQASFVESVRQSRFWLLSLQEIFSDGNAYGLDAARWNSEAFITWAAECMSYVI